MVASTSFQHLPTCIKQQQQEVRGVGATTLGNNAIRYIASSNAHFLHIFGCPHPLTRAIKGCTPSHTHTHTRTHGQTHTSTLSRTFATPNRTELNILPRKAKSVISSIYSTASCFFGLTFSAHSVLPCSLAQQKLKALKMPREWGSGYIDWMRWAGPRGLGYCTELLGRRTFHAGG